jgi:hypothetical protein
MVRFRLTAHNGKEVMNRYRSPAAMQWQGFAKNTQNNTFSTDRTGAEKRHYP